VRRRVIWALVIAAASAAIVGVIAIQRLRAELTSPFGGLSEPVVVVIQPGTTANAVATSLAQEGVVRDARLLVAWLWWNDLTGRIHAGEYQFSDPLSVAQVATVITEGRVLQHALTIPEGSTRWQVAAAIAAAGFGSREAALEATANADLITDLCPEATTLEGYLYPDTYLAPASDSPEQIVTAMVRAFRDRWDQRRSERAEQLGMSVHEVVTLASLIEAETPSAQERPIVSAVFHNRLRKGMLLQTDPTVLYSMRLAGKEGRTIHRSDLARDSPYNTYRVPGLPPGPIGNPRAASLDAALWPADVDYLYFVSRNDGTHAFSRTLGEHNRRVNQYQRLP